MLIRTTALASALLLLGGTADPGRQRPENETDKASYSLGHQIGRDLNRLGKAVDPAALRQGLLDGLSGAGPAVDVEVMRKLLSELKRQVQAGERAWAREDDALQRRKGREFIARNKEKPGVVTLPSGLQYEVIEPGTGRSPGPADKVMVHYRGTTLDGKVFHDSRVRPGKPETLHVSGTIAGLTEALQRMKAGGRWRIFLPPDLAYGRRGPLANHTVIFEVDLIAIVKGDEPGK